MAERLACFDLRRILVADLTKSDLDVSVVRVLVPGLECVAVDEYRVGARALAAVHEAQAAAGERDQ
jgi:ribosomal protein S12 methylthiotransferase accessory factor YcaO